MAFPGDAERLARLSLIDEAASATCAWRTWPASAATPSTAWPQLHSELLKQDVLADFHALWPEKFINVTNGVTPRRWMVLSNPRLTQVPERRHRRRLDPRPGRSCRRLEAFADDAAFRREWRYIKRSVKEDFTNHVRRSTGIAHRPGIRCSTCRSSASTNTSAST